MPRRASPLVYERFTEGGRYVAAMVESPDTYTEDFGYRPSDEARRILATYPASGVYRTDDLSTPILAFEGQLEEPDIVGFFEQNDSAYLITSRYAALQFHRDNVLVRELSGFEQLEWIHAPWFYLYACGAGPAVGFRLDETGPRRQVVVETPEGARFRYDALTGRLVSVSRERFGDPATATPQELDLAATMSQLLEESTVEPGEFGRFDLDSYMAEAVVESCMFVEQPILWETHPVDGEKPRLPPGFASLSIDAHGGSRLRHRREAVFDLYRVPAGQGSRFLCGDDLLEDGWLEEKVQQELGTDQLPLAWRRVEKAFRGPTVAALTTWDAASDGEWEGVGRPWNRDPLELGDGRMALDHGASIRRTPGAAGLTGCQLQPCR